MSSRSRAFAENRQSGVVHLDSGESSGVVSVAFGTAPSTVALTVQTPNDAVIAASVSGVPRSDGFDFSLSSAPETSNCKLHYICDF